MYTRSYRNSTYPSARSLPPDYGGTALVIAPAESSPPRQQPEPRFAERRQQLSPLPEDNQPRIRRETSVRQKPTVGRGPLSPPPFGGQGQPSGDPTPNTDIPASVERNDIGEQEEAVRLSRLFDPTNLKSDDLLLLGLILLFLSEGEENGRDALLLLAALYMAGV